MTELQNELKPRCPLRNAYVSGLCDCNGRVLSSKDGDLRLTIPKGAVKDGNLVEIFIATDLYGPFVLPSNCKADLVSPYYWIGVSGSYSFQKPVKVEFEHFAVVSACDPSHFQLLTCEDEDESHTMQCVSYNLDFTLQGDISLCTFETYKFCSYCLLHGCKDPVINRIAAIYLKSKEVQHSNPFTVEIWFSLPISHCMERNKKLYTQEQMILDKKCSYNFEASCDKNSTESFILSYDKEINDWYISHSRSTVIETKCINFYNYYSNMEDLEANEEASLFPPRFILNVRKKVNCNSDLDTNIMVTLDKTEEKSPEPIPFYLFVPSSIEVIRSEAKNDTAKSTETTVTQRKLSFDEHCCGEHCCDENKPELKELVEYSKRIANDWELIAIHLKVSVDTIDVINIDCKDRVEAKCRKMFQNWLQSSSSPCWCHFIKALYKVKLCDIAEEVTRKCLKHHSKSRSPPASPKVNVAKQKESDSQITNDNQCIIS